MDTCGSTFQARGSPHPDIHVIQGHMDVIHGHMRVYRPDLDASHGHLRSATRPPAVDGNLSAAGYRCLNPAGTPTFSAVIVARSSSVLEWFTAVAAATNGTTNAP